MQERRVRRWIRKAAEGDTRAFARLYDLYANRVYGFVRTRVDDVRDAEEITESVFLKAYRSLPTFEDRGLPFAAWLFRVARNEVIDFVRLSGRRVQAVDEPNEDVVSDVRVDEEAIARLDAQRVRQAVESLTAEQAEVVIARFFWGLSVADTAKAVGRSPGAVKALQHRAVRSLYRLLDQGETCSEDEVDEQAM